MANIVIFKASAFEINLRTKNNIDMKEKLFYQTPEVVEISISVENPVCEVSRFNGFDEEEDWDN